jgi:hypothetical protein
MSTQRQQDVNLTPAMTEVPNTRWAFDWILTILLIISLYFLRNSYCSSLESRNIMIEVPT